MQMRGRVKPVAPPGQRVGGKAPPPAGLQTGSARAPRTLAPSGMLEVQRAAGNRAACAAVQRQPGLADPARTSSGVIWDQPTWAKPSSEGAKGGVILVKVRGETYALKAAGDEAAAVVFGERALSTLGGGGITTTGSVPVPTASSEGEQIIFTLYRAGHSVVADDERENFFRKLAGLQAAKYILVQKGLSSAPLSKVDIGSVLPRKGWVKAGDTSARQEMMSRLSNLGRTLAADLFVGNADRLDAVNPDNIFVEGGGRIGAIDTEAVLQQRDGGHQSTSAWASTLISGGVANVAEEGELGLPSSQVARVTNFDDWFDVQFKPYFREAAAAGLGLDPWRLSDEQRQRLDDHVAQFDWDLVRSQVRKGFDDGIREITRLWQGKRTRREFRSGLRTAEQAYGKGMNLDWHALRVKASYIAASASGAEAAMARAREEAAYLRDWKPQIVSLVAQLDRLPAAELYDVPALPPELSKLKKLGRFVRPRSADEKQAAATKKKLRAGELSPEEVGEQMYAGGGRRSEKTAFLVMYQKVMNTLETRRQALDALRGELGGAGELRARKQQTIRRYWNRKAVELDTSRRAHEKLAERWSAALAGEQTYAPNLAAAAAAASKAYWELEKRLLR